MSHVCLFHVSVEIIILFINREGTTDITRTVHFGTPTAFEKVNEFTYRVNTFGLIKTVSDAIFYMVVTTYHDKHLIFSRRHYSFKRINAISDTILDMIFTTDLDKSLIFSWAALV